MATPFFSTLLPFFSPIPIYSEVKIMINLKHIILHSEIKSKAKVSLTTNVDSTVGGKDHKSDGYKEG